jgi:hypothetical protein
MEILSQLRQMIRGRLVRHGADYIEQNRAKIRV